MIYFFAGFILTARLFGWLGLAVAAVVFLAGLSGSIVAKPGPVCRFLDGLNKEKNADRR